MPELPEVETVRRVLEDKLVGTTITGIDVYYQNIIEDELDYFKANVIGKKIVGLSRLGKYLIFNLEDGAIVSHLRMEGKYFYLPKKSELNKHIHVVFNLSNDYILCYQDTRKFGRMVYKSNDDLYTTAPLSKIGYEPFIANNLDSKEIYNKIIKRNLPIKAVLLEQSIITGLGNIYVDEVLFASKILPDRPANNVSLAEVESIINECDRILSKAIEYKGTTIRSYTSSLGVKGGYQDFLLVHTKTACPHCNDSISKMKVGGRTSYYCKNCQR
ncbi:MAG: DNA-formamidopyrimidine glycosylase [Acholeplasmatales bacterium]|nr:DNA-formamidopyrimidine glycosylase [Acholeplasmatales bacterium]